MTKKLKPFKIDDELLVRIGAIADETGAEAHVVGGYVRDSLLGRSGKDLDIVVVGDGIEFARTVAGKLGGRQVVVYEKFGTAMMNFDDRKVEFVSAREESYEPASRKPSVRKATLESDLSRRDFTINAMAVGINEKHRGELADPFDGASDLTKKVIRTPLAPDRTFDDDPLRMMR